MTLKRIILFHRYVDRGAKPKPYIAYIGHIWGYRSQKRMISLAGKIVEFLLRNTIFGIYGSEIGYI